MCVFIFAQVCVSQCSLVVCVCATVHFIVCSHGIGGCFHLSVPIIAEGDLVNCLSPGTRLLIHSEDMLYSICC